MADAVKAEVEIERKAKRVFFQLKESHDIVVGF